MSTDLEQIWARMQQALTGTVDDAAYRVWLAALTPRELVGETLFLEAPERSCAWIAERFGRLLQRAALQATGAPIAVEVVPAPSPRTPSAQTTSRRAAERPAHKRLAGSAANHRQMPSSAHGEPLNPRFTFEQFVIGDANRLAHAAALTVAELPGHAYNPLFICGPPGVGKTHLLRAIANLARACNPGLDIRTCTGEAFTNEFQLALAGGALESFKSRFRDVDVLLVDDIQFLERKVRTEEEFFHTFNTLYEAGAQVVLTSDRPPRDLQALEDRLRERFEAGLVADIQPPDLSTRLAILRKRAHQDNITSLQSGTLEMIAERISLNVRTLEGALIRVVAFSSLTGRPLTPQLATEVLNNLYPRAAAARRSLDDIHAAAARHFNLSPEELLSSSRATRVMWPRQVAMYLARELTDESLPAIGRHFGRRDHTTVMHAVKRAEQRINADPSSRQTVDDLRRQLQNPHR